MTSPVALVLDDVHVLHDPGCRAAMPVLADHVPDGSQLVLAGRDAPPLPIARLRAEGRVMEIGPGDLALTLAEAASLLREAGITLGQDDLAELHRRIEGWPAGLYLAALSLREGGSVRNSVASFTGEHHLVSEYIQSEFLARISTAAAGVPDPDRGAGAAVRPAVRGGARRGPGPPRPWRIWRGRTCCWCRWTRRASGTATITCSATCCWPSCAAGSRS